MLFKIIFIVPKLSEMYFYFIFCVLNDDKILNKFVFKNARINDEMLVTVNKSMNLLFIIYEI